LLRLQKADKWPETGLARLVKQSPGWKLMENLNLTKKLWAEKDKSGVCFSEKAEQQRKGAEDTSQTQLERTTVGSQARG
jgi:hypothetical protein